MSEVEGYGGIEQAQKWKEEVEKNRRQEEQK